MGAVASIPVMPIQMTGNWVASCLGAACCSAFMNSFNSVSLSIATRILYALLFLVNSTLSWIMLSERAIKKLETLTYGLIEYKEGASFLGVQRLNFSLGLVHLLLAAFLFGVDSTRNPRARIQNGWWPLKISVYLGFVAMSFTIPDRFFELYGNYVALSGALLFNLIGLILLVDFAHEWSETCLEHIQDAGYAAVRLEEDDDEFYDSGHSSTGFWTFLLVGGTVLMYLATIALTVVMYVYFSSKGCGMNTTFITLNLILAGVVTLLLVSEPVREAKPSNGLGQSAMVSVYCTYLVLSACCSAPDGKCNPVIRSLGTKTMNVVLSAVFTLVAIAYTTTRAAANSAFSHTVEERPDRAERAEALRQAVREGALPESALEDLLLYEEASEDDEKYSTKYSYFIFHLIFLLATQFVATLLTMNVDKEQLGGFVPVGRTHFYSTMKMVSALVCYFLYGWSLVAPVVFPDRFG